MVITMERPKYEPGEFALVEGQIVEIIDRKIGFAGGPAEYYTYKVRLKGIRLTNWLDEEELEPLQNQKTPQILYGRKNK